ncbi:MAG: IS3 family transposase [Bacteroidales bacterium]|nr:IS3 family transposase [Bacteroidales bacterium]
MIVSIDHKLSVRQQCKLLGISRSGFYYQPVVESQENLKLMRLMDEHYLKHPTHGVLRMQDHLRSLGYAPNEKRVRRLLRLMGLMAIYPKKNLSKLGLVKYICPYLIRELKIDRPNQVWAIDITYIPMAKGFLYLTAIIDLYSRFVVSWGISNSLDAASVHDVFKRAILKHGKPEIINSDQGSQFTCKEWTELMAKENVQISMDGKGRALDNIFIERLWRSVKYDHVYLWPANDGRELYLGLKEYFQYYNFELAHQGIGRKTPAFLYRGAA